MPTNDLSPAAEAFLGIYCQEVFSEDAKAMRADLAALLETVRAEERVAHAAAEEHVGKLQAALYCFLDLLEQGYPLRADDPDELSPEFAEALRDGWEAMGGREGERAAREGQIAALLETVRAEAAPRWTACAKGLPPLFLSVLVWRDGGPGEPGYCGIAWLEKTSRGELRWGYQREDSDWFPLSDGTHWQRLPPGPEEDDPPPPPVP